MKFRSLTFTAVLVLGSCPLWGAQQTELFKLLPNDGAANDHFGFSVAVSGTTVIAGASLDDTSASNTGSAYLFDATTGLQTFKLLALDREDSDWFGRSVGISGSTAIAGSQLDDDFGNASGSAYLFDTTTGLQTFKLLPNGGAGADLFGHSVAVDGTIAIVGSQLDDDNGSKSGSAYLFDTTTGLQSFKLLPGDGAEDDEFGTSVAISGGIAIVGAYKDDDNGDGSGSAYLFDTATGLQLFKLLPDDGAALDQFGWSVGISGTTAIVGAPTDDDNGLDSGSAYLFDATTGMQVYKLQDPGGAAGERFGESVGISGATAIVGAPIDAENGFRTGSVQLFDTSTGVRTHLLLASDPVNGDQLGFGVAISGETAIGGANSTDDSGPSSGSAYAFNLSPPGTAFCFGDTGCPCGNNDPTRAAGCVNSSGSGATLMAKGGASIAADDLHLTTTGAPPGNSGLYFMGGVTFAPVLVGDGLGCTGGLFRFSPGTVDATGRFSLDQVVRRAPAGQIVPGDTRHFQSWTRDVLCGPPPAPCPTPCGNGSNLSNGYTVVFAP